MSVLVLMYHGVERRSGPLFVDPELFERQLEAIVASGLPVLTISEVADGLVAGSLPPRAVALTFDDAFESVARQAAPMLAARRLPATVFCVSTRVGGTNDWPSARPGAPAVALASRSELAALVEAGFEIGAHGSEHAPLDTDDPATIAREVAGGREQLEEAIGSPVRVFAYPYGAGPSAAAARAVAATYRAACTTRIGRVDRTSDVHALPRVDAHYLRAPERFAAVLAGRAGGYLRLRRTAARVRRACVRDYIRE